MRFSRITPAITLCAGALLLIAAQDAPEPSAEAEEAAAPAEPSTFSEAFAEPPADPAADPAKEAAADAAPDPAAETADEPAGLPADPAEAAPPEAAPSDAADEPAAAPADPVETALPEAAPSDAADEPVAASAEAPPEPAAPAKGEPPTRAFMVGVWTEDLAKCSSALDFKADGTLIGPFPRWELSEEGVLTLAGSRQKIWLKVVDKNTMQSRRSETDPPRLLKRCPPATPSE